MEFQAIVDNIESMASIYAFDQLPDGSFSEIRMMALNTEFANYLAQIANAPTFYSGIPYRNYFHDINFENYCHKSATTHDPLYSYVNTRGFWLKGIYIPLYSDKENTFYCCYVLKSTSALDSDDMCKTSGDVANAVLRIGIKLNKSQDFTGSMVEALREISKICASGRCSIALVNKKEQTCSLITEYGEDLPQLKRVAAGMGRTPMEMIETWEKDLEESDCLILDKLDILKERDPQWYASLCSYNVSSIVLYAIRYNQELVGFLWVSNFETEKMLHIKETLELTSFFIGSMIANHQLISQFEFLSMIDMLTQVKNRNAMNQRVDQLTDKKGNIPKTIGVIFIDLNGLKKINDDGGHVAGDAILKKAANLLKNAFEGQEIYRAGGDEFVVLCPNVSEEAFHASIKNLRDMSDAENNVSFAIGADFCKDDYDICKSMQIADEKMYENKETYYHFHPDKKHRGN